MKLLVVLVALFLLAGCNTFDEPQKRIENTRFDFTLHINPELKTDGLAVWSNTTCTIYLKYYPICLAHELRHCIEGNWHDEKPNGEDCY